jgi:predicted site-specific integrase-resolvase
MKKINEKQTKQKYEKLSDYAKKYSIVYRTAWKRFKNGEIKGAFKDNFGNVLIPIEKEEQAIDEKRVAIYTRVSSSENKKNLEGQVERIKSYAIARGYQITEIVMEVGSGVNDNRKKLNDLLLKDTYGTILVEHKDRLTRFGFNYIETLLNKEGKKIEVVNMVQDEKSDLMVDMISVIYSFSAKMYGLRRGKKKSEKIIECLKED